MHSAHEFSVDRFHAVSLCLVHVKLDSNETYAGARELEASMRMHQRTTATAEARSKRIFGYEFVSKSLINVAYAKCSSTTEATTVKWNFPVVAQPSKRCNCEMCTIVHVAIER